MDLDSRKFHALFGHFQTRCPSCQNNFAEHNVLQFYQQIIIVTFLLLLLKWIWISNAFLLFTNCHKPFSTQSWEAIFLWEFLSSQIKSIFLHFPAGFFCQVQFLRQVKHLLDYLHEERSSSIWKLPGKNTSFRTSKGRSLSGARGRHYFMQIEGHRREFQPEAPHPPNTGGGGRGQLPTAKAFVFRDRFYTFLFFFKRNFVLYILFIGTISFSTWTGLLVGGVGGASRGQGVDKRTKKTRPKTVITCNTHFHVFSSYSLFCDLNAQSFWSTFVHFLETQQWSWIVMLSFCTHKKREPLFGPAIKTDLFLLSVYLHILHHSLQNTSLTLTS